MKYSADDLKDWVALFLPDTAQVSGGGVHETIPQGLAYDRCARVRQLSGSTRFDADQLAQRKRYEVIVRYDEGITALHIVYYDGRVLPIDDLTDVDEEHEWFRIVCSQREAGLQL